MRFGREIGDKAGWSMVFLLGMMLMFSSALLVAPAFGQDTGGGTGDGGGSNGGGNGENNDGDANTDQDQVCDQVVDIIIDNGLIVSGDQNNAPSDQQIAVIAQKLGVSVNVVQECVQEFLGDDGNDDGSKDDDDGSEDDNDADDGDADDGVIDDTVPDKDLPDTGGFSLIVAGGVALLSAFGILTAWRSRER